MLTLGMYSIEFTRQARKALAKMPKDVKALVFDKLAAVAADPYSAHNNVTRMQGRPEYRLRVQDWRVIYRVQDECVLLLVVKIGARGQVYK